MARYDKYEPMVGNFRAALAADWNAADVNTVIGVGLDANGRVVVGGGGNSGLVGVVCLTKARKAGEIVDVMKIGEVVDFDIAGPDDTATGYTAGTAYYLDGTGAVTAAAPAAGVNGVALGHTVEAGRLVVNVQAVQG